MGGPKASDPSLPPACDNRVPVHRVALVALVLLASCGSERAPGPPAMSPPSQVRGVITDVRMDGDAVTRFVVEGASGRHEILIDPQRDYGFDLRHLEEHRATGDPVLVELENRDGALYAVSIVDA
jgi:hypothetical protein